MCSDNETPKSDSSSPLYLIVTQSLQGLTTQWMLLFHEYVMDKLKINYYV